MMIIDIETTGVSPIKTCIVELASIKIEKPKVFYQKLCRIDPGDIIESQALEINGQSIEGARDLRRITQKEMLIDFFSWADKQGDFFIAGHNIGSFDLNFLKTKSEKYGLKFPFQLRVLDLHTLAQFKHFQINGKFLTDNGKSLMDLPAVLKFVGMTDNRNKHNALEDCKLEAEAFSRLLSSRGLFKEYAAFEIPGYLKKD